jgi:hypothetical protein
MDIQINDQFKLTSDPLNIVLEESYEKNRENESDPIERGWRKVGYYGSIESACLDILKRSINKSDSDTLYGLLKKIETVEENIISAIKGAKNNEQN